MEMSVPKILQDILHLYSGPGSAPGPLPTDALMPAFYENRGLELSGSGERRRVRFPPGAATTGEVGAPTPALHGPAAAVSVHEVLSAYVSACRAARLSPSTKVEKQISTFTARPGQRQEALSLRGEKVKEAGMNVLESILSRVQFRSLDFEYSFLDDEAVVALADMLEYYDSALKLNLSFNQHIGLRGWQALTKVIRKSPCLEQINLRYTSLNEKSVPLLARALRADSVLRVLHVENCALSGKSMLLLACALKGNCVLEELYLAENGLNPSDAAHLYQIVSCNSSITLLDLRNNALMDAGISHICDALRSIGCRQSSRLSTLVLWNNRLTPNGVKHVARALLENKTLQTLNMGCNSIGAEGVAHAKDALARNRSLLRLGLQATKLNCQGAITIAEAIAENPTLIRVDLRENPDIRSAGLLALHLALKINTSITTLNLDRSASQVQGNSSSKDYGEQFRQLYSEMEDFCERNKALYEVKLLQEFEREQKEENESREESCSSTEEEGPGLAAPGTVLHRDTSLTCADSLSKATFEARRLALDDVEKKLARYAQPIAEEEAASTEVVVVVEASVPDVSAKKILNRLSLTIPPALGSPVSGSSPVGSPSGRNRFKVSPVPRGPSTVAPLPPTPVVKESAEAMESAVRGVVEDLLTFCVYEVGSYAYTPSVSRSRAQLLSDFAARTPSAEPPPPPDADVAALLSELLGRLDDAPAEAVATAEEAVEDAAEVAGVVGRLVRDAARLEREEHRASLRLRRQQLEKRLGKRDK